MATLMEEAKEAQKNIENVEKIIDDPGLCKKIYNSVYQANNIAIEIEENDGKEQPLSKQGGLTNGSNLLKLK
jgi:hypothetical protein